MITLNQLNGAATRAEFAALLDGAYEHSPWIAERAFDRRPFESIAQLQHAFATVLREAGREAQLALIRAHPELAGKAMVRKTLTVESAHEQGKAGLSDCSPVEFERLQQLNTAYNAKFGWPFILAVRGPRGTGLTRQQILDTFERRLANPPEFEFAECLRNIHRVVELRLADKFGVTPTLGEIAWDCAKRLATWSDPPFSERGELTVTYLTDAHRACQGQLLAWMRECGFDEVRLDAVGNVVGIYWGTDEASVLGASKPSPGQGRDGVGSGPFRPATPVSGRRLLTGSHYDTVRNGGRFDGRLGIFVPLIVVRELHLAGRRLPFGLEVVAFAEEEGQRYKATFLGSGALTGHFDPAWLDQRDADGVPMRDAMRAAGLPATLEAIRAETREPSKYLGFVEVHIEQGPVLNALDLPLGIVTSINGGVRYLGVATGTASHAGTTPMTMRHDAACAVAELALFLERRAATMPELVGTVGMLEVPGGSINVVPGRCRFSLDIRATTDEVRDACAVDVLAEARRIGERRGVAFAFEETMRAAAAPSDAALQQRWEAAVAALGLPIHRMPSGAGHDAMKLAEVMPQAMLFVRGENAGISHNPLESSTAHDCELAVRAFQHFIDHLAR